jgi:hypothetical protein
VSVVAFVTTTLVTVIPAPVLSCVVPFTQLVLWPVRVTIIVYARGPAAGDTETTMGVFTGSN